MFLTNSWVGSMPDDADGSAANADAAGAAAGASGGGAAAGASGADAGGAGGSGTGEGGAAAAGGEQGASEGGAGEGGEAAGGDAGGEAAAKPDGQDDGAPEAYADFTLPEGFEMDAELGNAFKEAAKADNLSQAKAQRYIGLATDLVQKTLTGFQKQGEERVAQWAEQLKTDPEVGGRDYAAKVQVALDAVGKFGDQELKDLFTEYGLGNHPAMVRFAYRIGKAAGESGFVHGQGQESPAKSANREQQMADRIAAEQARNAKK